VIEVYNVETHLRIDCTIYHHHLLGFLKILLACSFAQRKLGQRIETVRSNGNRNDTGRNRYFSARDGVVSAAKTCRTEYRHQSQTDSELLLNVHL